MKCGEFINSVVNECHARGIGLQVSVYLPYDGLAAGRVNFFFAPDSGAPIHRPYFVHYRTGEIDVHVDLGRADNPADPVDLVRAVADLLANRPLRDEAHRREREAEIPF